MKPFKLSNANSSVISVGATARPLLGFIDTAGAVSHEFPPRLDSVDIVPEDGDVRVMLDGNTPTASKGLLVKSGSALALRKVLLSDVRLIATTGTVVCSAQIGYSDPEDITAISVGAGAVTSMTPGTGASNLGKAEDAAHASGDVGIEMLGVRNDAMTALSGANGDYTPVATDQYGGLQIAQPTVFTPVTISDATDLTALATKGIFCSVPLGVTTTLAVRLLGASSTTVTVVLYSSQYLPGMFTRVMSAGTTLNGATITAFS